MRGTASRTLLLALALAPPLTLGGCAGVSGGVGGLDKTYKNSIGMEFVLIPAGTFLMGCESTKANTCWVDEKPRHKVKISRPFYLGKYEVTQAQWQAVMGNNPSEFKGATHPVDSVSWNDVQEFIRKLNEKEGHTRYRLPTEAEWEYAARAGSTTAYSFGDDENKSWHYAWHCDNCREGPTHPVGQKLPNAWGLFDMHGNVWEWVHDWYGREYYSAEAVTDPRGPEAGEGRVQRGGGWYGPAQGLRSAGRAVSAPGDGDFETGFRLALSPE